MSAVAYRSSPLSSSPDSSPAALPPDPPPCQVLPPQIEGSYFPPFPASSSSDAISKLQHLLNNSLAVIAEAMYQVGDNTPAVPHAVASQIANITYALPPAETATTSPPSASSDSVATTCIGPKITSGGGEDTSPPPPGEGQAQGSSVDTSRGTLRDCFEDHLVDDISERAHRLALILGCIQAQIPRLPSTTAPPVDASASAAADDDDAGGLLLGGNAPSLLVPSSSAALEQYYRTRVRELIRRNDEEEQRLLNVSQQLSNAYHQVTDRLRMMAKEGVRLA
eukprot:GHVS01091250.1.p1 GENE.GHVS01091250.1~~GHVS01091250.1.p1  ORF type:complete len:280 (+),score=63.89 GHVS01091250.1:226-1065(+)